MQCVSCSSEKFTEKKVLFHHKIKDELVEFSAPAFVCSKCNDALMNSEQMDFLLKTIKDKINQ